MNDIKPRERRELLLFFVFVVGENKRVHTLWNNRYGKFDF